jgi:phosphatidate cytidylyltransferase
VSAQETPATKKSGDLPARIAAALVLVPAALGTAWWGGIPFVLFWAAAAAIGWFEWTRLICGAGSGRVARAIGWAGIAAMAACFILDKWVVLLTVFTLCWAVTTALAPRDHWPWMSGGFPYASAILLGPAFVRTDPALGIAGLVVLFAIVWGTDVAAYFTGRGLGGPKLWPRVSPNKTWSGAIGGATAAVLLGLGFARMFGIAPTVGLGLTCLVLSVVSQGGDLFESHVKRRAGAKDAGHLIPGHGGVLDRLDGFLVAAALAAALGLLRGGPDAVASGFLTW